MTYLASSVGRKVVMGLTGLSLVLFLVGHLGGNLIMYLGPAAYNDYAHHLHAFPLLPIVELGLLAVFLVHIFLGITMTLQNRAARGPRGYAKSGSKQSGINPFFSRNMLVTGFVLLCFLVLHLAQFKFGLVMAGSGIESAYEKAVRILKEPVTIAVYLLGVFLLGAHLWHGFQSSFRSLGIEHPKYTPAIIKLGILFAIVATVGYASLPVFTKLFL
jgi:succinate dehydrogenase / fumarate reductase, cytochrome b subunit